MFYTQYKDFESNVIRQVTYTNDENNKLVPIKAERFDMNDENELLKYEVIHIFNRFNQYLGDIDLSISMNDIDITNDENITIQFSHIQPIIKNEILKTNKVSLEDDLETIIPNIEWSKEDI